MNKKQEQMAGACYTVIAGKKASATGHVIVGHNEDDGGRCIFRYGMVPAADWPEGTTLPAEDSWSVFAPAKQDIPQVAHTYGYFWGEAVDNEEGKYLGMSGADAFVNEKGVCLVSNNGGQTTKPTISGGSEGVFYVLRRAVMERAATPLEGVMVAAGLIRDYGYKACRDYTIADKDEAWVLEVAQGHSFVARKVADDEVVTIPNFFTVRGVDFAGGKELAPGIMGNGNWIWSKNLVQDAIDKGVYKPQNIQDTLYKDFDFAWCYQSHEENSGWNASYNNLRMKHGISIVRGEKWLGDNSLVTAHHPEIGFPFAVKPGILPDNKEYQGKFTLAHCRKILRTHFEGTEDDPVEAREKLPGRNPHESNIRRICTQTTGEAIMVEFAETTALTTVWLAPGRPCQLPFFPMHPLSTGQVPEGLRTIKDGAEAMAHHCQSHPGISAWQEHNPWFRMRDYENRMDLLYCSEMDEANRWLAKTDSEYAPKNTLAVKQAGVLSGTEQKKFLLQWDNASFEKIYGAVEARCQNLPEAVLVMKKKTFAKKDGKDNLLVEFTLPSGKTPDIKSLLFGLGMTNTQKYSKTEPFPWEKPLKVEKKETAWEATFAADSLITNHPAVEPGQMEYYLSGNDTDGQPFCGMVVLTILP